MRFMLLLKRDAWDGTNELPGEQFGAAFDAYNDELLRAGVLIAAEGLVRSAPGARLRLDRGGFTLTEGPFTESQGSLVGFWVIQTPSKAAALAWAERCPVGTAATGPERAVDWEVEVRAIVEPDELPVDADPAGWREREAAFRAGGQEGQPDEVSGARGGVGASTTRRFTMNFMADGASEAGLPPGEQLLAEMGSLMAELAQTGVLLAGEGLQASAQGARVTWAAGKRSVVDGPFAETKELIAGYALIRADSRAAAIAVARRCLVVDARCRHGASTIDVRQVSPGPTASRSPISTGEEGGGSRP